MMIRSALPVLLLTAAAAGAQTTPPAPAQTSRPATTAATASPQTAPTSPTQAAPAAPAATGPNPTVGGATVSAATPIATGLTAAPTLSSLAAAVKAAGVDATLAGPGPFTVFAPSNDAFGRLAPGTVETLMKPANKPSLIKLLTYHVVPGAITLADLTARLTTGGGTTTLTSVEGEPIVIAREGNAISLTDVSGHKSYLETPDVRQANGVIHVVNGVLVPKLN